MSDVTKIQALTSLTNTCFGHANEACWQTDTLLISTVRFGINLRLEKGTEPQNLQILKITDYYKSKIITFFLYLSKESMQR